MVPVRRWLRHEGRRGIPGRIGRRSSSMTEPEVDATPPASWRQLRWLLPYVFAISLGSMSHDVTAATYWQVQQSEITVFVEGDKDVAKRFAETTLRLQSAARWLFNWPSGHREPPTLIFAVGESLLRSTFQYPAGVDTAYTEYTAG